MLRRRCEALSTVGHRLKIPVLAAGCDCSSNLLERVAGVIQDANHRRFARDRLLNPTGLLISTLLILEFAITFIDRLEDHVSSTEFPELDGAPR